MSHPVPPARGSGKATPKKECNIRAEAFREIEPVGFRQLKCQVSLDCEQKSGGVAASPTEPCAHGNSLRETRVDARAARQQALVGKQRPGAFDQIRSRSGDPDSARLEGEPRRSRRHEDLDDLDIAGSESWNDRGITLRARIKVRAQEQSNVKREYLMRLKHAFDTADIQQPRATVTIIERGAHAASATPEGPPA